MYQTILQDIACYPFGEYLNEGATVYNNSWGGKRVFDGKRRQEETVIMIRNNKKRYFSVFSMTD